MAKFICGWLYYGFAHRRGVLALAALLSLSACPSAGLEPPITGPIHAGGASLPAIDRAFWLPGEVATFDVSLRGVVVAEMVVAVGEPGVVAGREIVVVRSRAKTKGLLQAVRSVTEVATSWIDRRTAATVKRDMFEKHGDQARHFHLIFGPGAATISRWNGTKTGAPQTWTMTTPNEAIFDNQSILGFLRSWWPSEPGAIGALHAVTDRILNRHVFRFSGRERVEWGEGRITARRYDVDLYTAGGLALPKQSYSIWFADNDNRAPVRMRIPHRFGRVTLSLRSHDVSPQAATAR